MTLNNGRGAAISKSLKMDRAFASDALAPLNSTGGRQGCQCAYGVCAAS
jgi:hypothetical protein